MMRFIIIFLKLLLIPLSISAQNADCLRMLYQADSLAIIKDFEKAINKYRAAETCDRLLQQQVDLKIKEVFVAINKEKEAAIKNEREAIKQRNIADEKTELAEKNGNQSKANELAATAREVWATERDSITALRIAEAAIKVTIPPTPKAIESLRDILNASFRQPIKSINLIKRHVHSKSDLDYLSNYFPFSPSLKYFISNSISDNSIRIWQLSNGQNIYKFIRPNQTIVDFGFSQNDEYVMMMLTSNGVKITVEVLHLTSGKLLFTYPDTLGNTIKKIFFFDNKPMLFYQSDSFFKILDISTQSIVKTIPQIKSFNLSNLQFSPNGNRIFLSGTLQESDSNGIITKGLIKIWDLEKNIFSNEFKISIIESYDAFAISKDNKYMALAYKTNFIEIIDLESNQVVKKLVGYNSNIINLVFSDDSKFLLSGGTDGEIKFWNIEWGLSIQTYNIQNRTDLAYHIAISSDNKNIITYSLGFVNVWRTIVDILDPTKSPTLTEEERKGYGVPDRIKD